MTKIKLFVLSAALVVSMFISACGNPIVAVDNAISPEGQNCGALVC